MEIKSELPSAVTVGLIAGTAWNYLHSNGRTSIIKLKSELLYSATELHLALGWLLRESKIEFLKEDGLLFVKLK